VQLQPGVLHFHFYFFFEKGTKARTISIILIIQGFNPNLFNSKLTPASIISVYLVIRSKEPLDSLFIDAILRDNKNNLIPKNDIKTPMTS